MSDARRGELRLIDLGEPLGHDEPLGHEQGWQRPALVVSSDEWNRHAATVVVTPLTRTRHGLPTRVEIEPTLTNGLRDTSYARVEDIRVIGAARLVRRMGRAEVLEMHEVGRILRTFLEI